MNLSFKEMKMILNNTPNLIWRSGKDGKCDFFNKAWLDFTGKTLEEEVGDGWAEGVHPDDFDRCLNTYVTAFSKREAFEMEYRLLRHDGKYRVINDRGVPYYDENDDFLGYIGSCIDVTEKVEGELLREMAIKDSLTGLFDRQYLLKLIELEISLDKSDEKPMSLIMIDIDSFKKYNDSYGHTFGDKVIVETANIIMSSVRENDSVGRYGGDEFLILLPKTDKKHAISIANRLCENLSNHSIHTETKPVFVEVSIGLSEFSNDNDYIKMINKVDHLMYEAKKYNGSHICY